MNKSAAASFPLARLAPLLAIAAAALLLIQSWHETITLENVVALRDRFRILLQEHRALAVLIYLLVYATSVSLSLPGGLILSTAGGFLFGTLVGGIAATVGASMGAVVVFLLVKTCMEKSELPNTLDVLLRRRLGGGAGRMVKLGAMADRMRTGFREDAMSYLLFLRIIPGAPFFLVNLMAPALGVPLRTYVVATFFGIMPAVVAFASLGAGLDSIVAAAKAERASCVSLHGPQACTLTINANSLVSGELMLAFALLGMAALAPVAYKRWRKSHAAAE